MKLLVFTVIVGVAYCQDGSYMLDSRGVQVEQGLVPSKQLYDNYEDFSDAFRQRSREMATQYSFDQTVYNDPNPEYTWAYAVDAKSTGDQKTAREERRGDVVVGQYSVVDPDGTLRTVDYSVAPGTGFQATVSKEKISDGIQTPTEYRQSNQYQNQQYNRNQQRYQQSNQNKMRDNQYHHQNYRNSQFQDETFQNYQQNYRQNSRNQMNSMNEFQNQYQNQQNYRNQNQQNYRQDNQNQNNYRFQPSSTQGSGIMLKSYGNRCNQRYGYNRNSFDNSKYNNQGSSLYSRNVNQYGQYSQRYGSTNSQYNQRQYNYNQNQKTQLQDSNTNSNRYYNRLSTNMNRDQYDEDYYKNQQRYERYNDNNNNNQYRTNRNMNEYENQYFRSKQMNNNQRSQYNRNNQFQTSRFSQSNQNLYNQRDAQFYSRQNSKNQNRYNGSYSPISVVLAGNM